MFFKKTIRFLRDNKDALEKIKLTKLVEKTGENNVIEFKKIHDKWVAKKDEEIKIVLREYLLQKSFILALVTRNVRYATISNQKPLIKLMKYRLRINKYENLTVRFIYDNKIKEFKIVKHYLSKNSIFSKAITKSRYFNFFLDKYSYQYLRKVQKINETRYLNHI